MTAINQIQMSRMADSLPVMFAYCDAERRYQFANRPYAHRFGLEPKDILGKTIVEIFGDPAYAEICGHLDAALTGKPVEFEIDVDYPNLGVRIMQCSYHPDFDRAGGVQGVTAALIDITERLSAEALLRDSERRYRLLLEGLPQLVWSCLPDGRCDYLSRQWVDYTGKPEAEQLGYGWAEAVHLDDRENLFLRWEESVKSGDPFDVEFRLRRGTGEYRWFKTRAVLFRESDGTRKWFGTSTDIEDKKVIENELKKVNATLEARVEERTRAVFESEQKFRSAFDFTPIGMALVSPDFRWLQVNRSLCDLLGYTEEELLATDLQGVSHPEDRAASVEYLRRTLAGEIPFYHQEKRYFHKDGHVVYAQLSVSLLRDGNGAPLYFIGQVDDITERKNSEAKIKASLREKEILLKEIHHRVKNNLQIVSTLLDLQSDHTKDRAALEMFQESRRRVKSIALIHERLYRSEDLSRVDFTQYIRQLAEDLYETYKISSDEILTRSGSRCSALADRRRHPLRSALE